MVVEWCRSGAIRDDDFDFIEADTSDTDTGAFGERSVGRYEGGMGGKGRDRDRAMKDITLEDMLANLDDASFEPYRSGASSLQIRDNRSGRKSRYVGERLIIPRQADYRGVLVPTSTLNSNRRRGVKLSHPSYAHLDDIERDLSLEVRRLSLDCSVLERRMLLLPEDASSDETEKAEQAFDDVLRELAQRLKSLSHVAAYRRVTNVFTPSRMQAELVGRVEHLLEERKQLISEATSVAATADGRSGRKDKGDKRRHPDKASASGSTALAQDLLRRAAARLSEAEDVLASAGNTTVWPGKIDRIVLSAPRTVNNSVA